MTDAALAKDLHGLIVHAGIYQLEPLERDQTPHELSNCLGCRLIDPHVADAQLLDGLRLLPSQCIAYLLEMALPELAALDLKSTERAV